MPHACVRKMKRIRHCYMLIDIFLRVVTLFDRAKVELWAFVLLHMSVSK